MVRPFFYDFQATLILIKSNLLLIGLFRSSSTTTLIGVVCALKKSIAENELIPKGLNGLNKCTHTIKLSIGANPGAKVGNVLTTKSF